jgi:nucleoside-diphosphate-sugar epimerase/predicted dehydrogenase
MTQSSARRETPSTRLKVGLLGAGYICRAHAKAIGAVAQADLRWVCDASASRAREIAAEFGIRHVCTSLAELAASDCDVVHVLLPPYLHESAAEQLLRAGKNVFIEKPMGLSAATCRSLAELAAANGLQLGVNHNFLFTPGYESLRSDAKDGSLGPLDQITINWLYGLGLLQSGPYDNWIVGAEGNMLFEVGSHLAAFVLDLAGPATELLAAASLPLDLPGAQRVFRHWQVAGSSGSTAFAINLSFAPGHPERSIQVRAAAGAAQLDFERNLYWRNAVRSNSGIFDQLGTARHMTRQIGRAARNNVVRYLGAVLRREPKENAFQESITRSVGAFYHGFAGVADERLSGHFGASVIAFCERIVTESGHEAACPPKPLQASLLPLPKPATVLIVGGAGFIGRRLVEALSARGQGVRVLSRNRNGATLALAGLPVEIVQGSHGDPGVLEQALDGIEVVYHLAKATGRRWGDYVEGDIAPTKTLAEACLARGVRRFVYTGTIDAYDSARAAATIDGETPLDPRIGRRNLYARSKAACEEILMGLHRTKGLPLVILRPGIVIGAGSPPSHWGVGMFHSDTRAEIWGEGSTKLPLVLVDDVAAALALAADAPGIEGQTLLVTDAPLLTAREYIAELTRATRTRVDAGPTPIWRFFLLDVVKEAVKHLVRHPNRKLPSYHDWDCRAHRARYDSSRTKALLGWAPAGTREAIVERGIDAAVRSHYGGAEV